MTQSSQTALLDLIDSYLQELRREAETLTTIAQLINRSIEGRRAMMSELEAHFMRRPGPNAVATPHPQQTSSYEHPAWSAASRVAAGPQRTDALLRELDTLVNQQPAPMHQQWPGGYHA